MQRWQSIVPLALPINLLHLSLHFHSVYFTVSIGISITTKKTVNFSVMDSQVSHPHGHGTYEHDPHNVALPPRKYFV